MTLTEPLIRPSLIDAEISRAASNWTDRNLMRLAVAGCVVFWLVVGTILYVSL